MLLLATHSVESLLIATNYYLQDLADILSNEDDKEELMRSARDALKQKRATGDLRASKVKLPFKASVQQIRLDNKVSIARNAYKTTFRC
jgi:hypothetical protein